MKCDNLIGRTFDGIVYVEASEAMEAIAELKAENQRLKKKMDDYHLMSDICRAKIKELKRALWLARAEWASDKARIFYFAETCGVKLNIDGYSNKEKGHTRMCSARWWRLTWLKVERKCRAKAEEYK